TAIVHRLRAFRFSAEPHLRHGKDIRGYRSRTRLYRLLTTPKTQNAGVKPRRFYFTITALFEADDLAAIPLEDVEARRAEVAVCAIGQRADSRFDRLAVMQCLGNGSRIIGRTGAFDASLDDFNSGVGVHGE